MSQKFNASIQNRDDVSYIKLAGVIDEDNELANLVDRIPRGVGVIDLGEIERINSCGVRDWVNWLSRLEMQGTRIILVECSPAIVAQINLVNNFTGSGVVKSFFVPYFCPECDEEKVLLVETAEMGPPPHEPPMCRCDECDLVMDFDDMPDSYFAFLSSSRRHGDADKLNGALRELNRPAAQPEKARVRSRVSSPAIAPMQKMNVPSLANRQPSQPNRLPPAPAYGAPLAGGGYGASAAPRPGSAPSRPQMSGNGQSGMAPLSSLQGTSGALGSSSSMSGLPPLGQGVAAPRPARAARGNTVIYALVAVLLLAIAALFFLLLTR